MKTEIVLVVIILAVLTLAQPSQSAVSNLTSSSATVSWVSPDSVDGCVRYGLTTALGDSACDMTVDNVHLGMITGLSTNTQYYFEVRSGAEVDNNAGLYYTFTTTEPGLGTPYTVFGGVFVSDSASPISRALVDITVTTNDSIGWASLPLSFLTDANGVWFFNLGNLKDSSTNDVYSYSTGDTIFVSATDGAITKHDTLFITGASPQDCGMLLLSGCCVDIRGNVDDDQNDRIDISDLVHLVDYMFNGGPAPPCWSEANVDANGPDDQSGIDISDLVYLVDYMFTGGPEPPLCP